MTTVPIYDKELIASYFSAGLNILPTSSRKLPILGWERYQYFMASPTVFDTTYKGLCVVCGSVSGNLEGVDIDNKFRDAFVFLKKIKAFMGCDFNQLVVNKTRSGGYHILYRCERIEGNRKLCMRKKMLSWNKHTEDYNREAILETRGEKGILVIPPTVGYETIQGSMLAIPTIDVPLRDKLINFCVSLNEVEDRTFVHEAVHNAKAIDHGDDRIGDMFNMWDKNGSYTRSLLIGHGWKFISKDRLVRPGKNHGHSATFGYCGDNVLYVWSPNAYPFEPNHTYTPFAVVAYLECGGDFRMAARRVAEMMDGLV